MILNAIISHMEGFNKFDYEKNTKFILRFREKFLSYIKILNNKQTK